MKQEEQMLLELNQQLDYYHELMDQLEHNLAILNKLKEDLNSLETLKEGDEILAPLANGIFLEAKLITAKKLKVNVGNGVVVEKSIPDTLKLLEKQEVEILSSKSEVQKKLEELYSSFQG